MCIKENLSFKFKCYYCSYSMLNFFDESEVLLDFKRAIQKTIGNALVHSYSL